MKNNTWRSSWLRATCSAPVGPNFAINGEQTATNPFAVYGERAQPIMAFLEFLHWLRPAQNYVQMCDESKYFRIMIYLRILHTTSSALSKFFSRPATSKTSELVIQSFERLSSHRPNKHTLYTHDNKIYTPPGRLGPIGFLLRRWFHFRVAMRF